jgi:uncharacterized RDD family membrane protein YckC
MVNCVECGAPLERAGDPCEACGAIRTPSTTNGTSHPRFEDPDGLIYEDSPLVRESEQRAHVHDESPHEPARDTPPEPVQRIAAPSPAAPVARAADQPAIRPAPFMARALAFAIDIVLLSMLEVALFVLAKSAVLLAEAATGMRVGASAQLIRSAVSAGSLTMFVGYFSVLHARSGQTLGKVAMRIQVRGEDGERVGAARGVLRTVSYALSALLFGAGFLLALLPGRRALHDRIAGTVVVREEEGA